jgi:hypothetical protein
MKVIVLSWVCSSEPPCPDALYDGKDNRWYLTIDSLEDLRKIAAKYDVMLLDKDVGLVLWLDKKGKRFSR